MKISVKVKITRSVPKVEVCDDVYLLYINKLPEKNKANYEVIDILSDYFHVSKKQVTIISGLKSKNKIVEILC